jgi:RNA-directed DNA polymerase
MANPSLVRMLARSFLAGEPSVEQMVARGDRLLGKEWRWLRPLARRYAEAFAGGPRPRHRDVVQFLLRDPGFLRAWSRYFNELAVAQWLNEPQRMLPMEAAAAWDVPPIESAGDLAAWFGLTPGELDWFADLKGLGCKRNGPRLGHYHYRILAKTSGGIRLIEAPKPRLKEIQRQILTHILDKIPPHPAAHGFLKGRSIKTFVAPHVGRRVVLRMDLKDFFPTFGAARIQTFFRVLGYPEAVADLLGGVCTNAVARGVWRDAAAELDPARRVSLVSEARALYSRPHLPQGAPTSPALANLCAYRADCRLAGLAKVAGAEYTRYADDLAFSGGGGWERRVDRFSRHVAAILLEEGFAVQHRKTRVMRQGVRQHLTRLVVNHHANIIRDDYDRLKAMLTNCVRHGPDGQNRASHPRFREHLEGRVGFVESISPTKGERLRKLLDEIQWPETAGEN